MDEKRDEDFHWCVRAGVHKDSFFRKEKYE